MGSIARMERAGRFIKEFGKDYEKSLGLRAGTVLTVLNTYLAQEDGGLEQVRMCVRVRDKKGEEFVLTDVEGVFDAENDSGDDLVERIVADLGITERQAEKRLRRAKLLD